MFYFQVLSSHVNYGSKKSEKCELLNVKLQIAPDAPRNILVMLVKIRISQDCAKCIQLQKKTEKYQWLIGRN